MTDSVSQRPGETPAREAAPIRVGVGGWDYEPWRGTFFPEGLAKAKQLSHAASRLTAIEVNATNYRLQRRETFERWAASVSGEFRFTLKASRYCTNRRDLREAEESVGRFIAQGLTALGDKLGPILWQFAPTKKLDAAEFETFLNFLPESHEGVRLRHALEPRNESFRDPRFAALAKARNMAVVFADSADYPVIDEATADFAYARLQGCQENVPTGYDAAALDRWARLAKGWAAEGRETFLFFIAGAKVRAPAAAEALIARL